MRLRVNVRIGVCREIWEEKRNSRDVWTKDDGRTDKDGRKSSKRRRVDGGFRPRSRWVNRTTDRCGRRLLGRGASGERLLSILIDHGAIVSIRFPVAVGPAVAGPDQTRWRPPPFPFSPLDTLPIVPTTPIAPIPRRRRRIAPTLLHHHTLLTFFGRKFNAGSCSFLACVFDQSSGRMLPKLPVNVHQILQTNAITYEGEMWMTIWGGDRMTAVDLARILTKIVYI